MEACPGRRAGIYKSVLGWEGGWVGRRDIAVLNLGGGGGAGGRET